VLSYDLWEPYAPETVVYGTLGTLGVPDANMFGGPVRFRPPCGTFDAPEWQTMPLTHGYAVEPNYRGIGVADLACALHEGRPHRASAEQAYHILEVMTGALESAETQSRRVIESTFEAPEPLSMEHRDGNRKATLELY
jgi:predicted dehydrogenase